MRGRVLTGIFVACYSGLALGQGTVSQTASVRELDAAFVCVAVGTLLANAYVVGLFRTARARTSTSWAKKWEFSPSDLGGFSWPQLAFWSLLSLFLELLMIRWISSEIRIFAYFKNFVLIACFLGFGLGCHLSRRRANLLLVVVGQLVGWYLQNASKGILAYSVNVLASLGGIILYTLLCFLNQPPMTWFLVAGLLLVRLLWDLRWLRWATALVFVACLGLLSLGVGNHKTVYWSPYQKLTLAPREDAGKVILYELTTNDIFYQQILDLSPRFVASHPELFDKLDL